MVTNLYTILYFKMSLMFIYLFPRYFSLDKISRYRVSHVESHSCLPIYLFSRYFSSCKISRSRAFHYLKYDNYVLYILTIYLESFSRGRDLFHERLRRQMGQTQYFFYRENIFPSYLFNKILFFYSTRLVVSNQEKYSPFLKLEFFHSITQQLEPNQ